MIRQRYWNKIRKINKLNKNVVLTDKLSSYKKWAQDVLFHKTEKANKTIIQLCFTDK